MIDQQRPSPSPAEGPGNAVRPVKEPGLPAEVREFARHLIAQDLREREGALVRTIERLQRDFRSNGGHDADARRTSITTVCAQELRLRTLLAWRTLQQAVVELGARADMGLAAGLKRELETYYARQAHNLRTVALEAQVALGGTASTPEAEFEDTAPPYDDVDRFVRCLASGVPHRVAAPATVLHPHASDTLRGEPSGSAYRMARAAVAFTLEQLRNVDAASGSTAGDVGAVLQEVQLELNRTVVNRLRVTSLLHGAAMALWSMPEMRPSYQELRVALLPFGYFLPSPANGTTHQSAA